MLFQQAVAGQCWVGHFCTGIESDILEEVEMLLSSFRSSISSCLIPIPLPVGLISIPLLVCLIPIPLLVDMFTCVWPLQVAGRWKTTDPSGCPRGHCHHHKVSVSDCVLKSDNGHWCTYLGLYSRNAERTNEIPLHRCLDGIMFLSGCVTVIVTYKRDCARPGNLTWHGKTI